MSTGRTLALATAMLLGLNVISRVTGFVREMVIAKAFGASAVTDAYIVATTIPNAIYLIGSYALVAVVIPVFLEYEGQDRLDEAWEIGSMILNTLSVVMIAVVGLGLIMAPWIVKIFAPGFTGETFRLTVFLTRVILPGSLFMTLGALLTGYLNCRNKFAVAAFAPILNNIFIILAALLLNKKYGALGLAFGTLAGAFMFFAVQLPAVFRQGFRPRLNLGLNNPGVRKAFKLMIPVVVGSGVNQLYLIIDKIMASGLAEGSISALNYANRVMQLPLNIFVLAVSSAFFPTMSKFVALKDEQGLAAVLNKGLKVVTVITIPAAVGLIVLSRPIVRVLYERGAFDTAATQMTSIALMFFSFGIFGEAVYRFLTRAFFSLHDTRRPVLFTLFTAIINVGFSLILRKYLAHAGLALSNSISATITAILVFIFLSRRIKGIVNRPFIQTIGKALFCAAVMGFVSDQAWQLTANMTIIPRLATAIFSGLTIYGILIGVWERREITGLKRYFLGDGLR